MMRARVSPSTSALRAIQPILGDSIPVCSSTSIPTNPAISSMSASSNITFVIGSYSTYLNPTCDNSGPNDPLLDASSGIVWVLVFGNSFSIHPSNLVGGSLEHPPPRRRSRSPPWRPGRPPAGSPPPAPGTFRPGTPPPAAPPACRWYG